MLTAPGKRSFFYLIFLGESTLNGKAGEDMKSVGWRAWSSRKNRQSSRRISKFIPKQTTGKRFLKKTKKEE